MLQRSNPRVSSFAAVTAHGPVVRTSEITFEASKSSSIASIIPIRKASLVSILPASIAWRLKLALPILLYTYGPITAGKIPSLPSDRAIFTSDLHITWSRQAINPAPPPRATPWIRPIVKQGCDHNPLNNESNLFESFLFSSGVFAPASLIMLISAPAQKCLPSPDNTRTLRFSFPSSDFSLPVTPTEFSAVQENTSISSEII